MAGELVLLTGATGFVGFRTLIQLLEAGYKVRIAVRNMAGFEKVKALKSAAPFASELQPIVVPVISAAGAYDEAVQGVTHVVHVASPINGSTVSTTDYEATYIQPAIKATVGILDSAAKVSSVNRVVITSSILAIVPLSAAGTGITVNESYRGELPHAPYHDWMEAYQVSKARAFEATKEWVTEHDPSFEVINIMPVFVTGRDETAANLETLARGGNGLLLGPLLGQPRTTSLPCSTVHVDDVAKLHVRALDRTIPGNQDYLASSHPLQSLTWDKSFDIIKKHYPNECEKGIFKVDTTQRPVTARLEVDSVRTEKVFGITFKSFEEQVLSVAEQYLELVSPKEGDDKK